jgi:hypothetical protein
MKKINQRTKLRLDLETIKLLEFHELGGINGGGDTTGEDKSPVDTFTGHSSLCNVNTYNPFR